LLGSNDGEWLRSAREDTNTGKFSKQAPAIPNSPSSSAGVPLEQRQAVHLQACKFLELMINAGCGSSSAKQHATALGDNLVEWASR
jgi:hypothetical protein